MGPRPGWYPRRPCRRDCRSRCLWSTRQSWPRTGSGGGGSTSSTSSPAFPAGLCSGGMIPTPGPRRGTGPARPFPPPRDGPPPGDYPIRNRRCSTRSPTPNADQAAPASPPSPDQVGKCRGGGSATVPASSRWSTTRPPSGGVLRGPLRHHLLGATESRWRAPMGPTQQGAAEVRLVRGPYAAVVRSSVPLSPANSTSLTNGALDARAALHVLMLLPGVGAQHPRLRR